MPITRTPMVDDDGSGQSGTVVNNSWKQELYNQIDAVILTMGGGAWTPVPFSAAYFVAASGTWTVPAGNVSAYHYMVFGKTLFLNFVVTSSTLSAATSTVGIYMPAGVVGAQVMQGPFHMSLNSGAWQTGFTYIPAGQSLITFYPTVATTPAFLAGALSLSTMLTIPIQ